MKKLLLSFFFVSLLVPALALAQNTNYAGNLPAYVPLEPISDVYKQTSGPQNFSQFLGSIFKISIILSALWAVGALIFGGVVYMVSEIANKKALAKKRIEAALWGLLLLVGAWLILNTINPQLLLFSNNIIPTTSTAQLDTTQAPQGSLVPGDWITYDRSAQEISDFTKRCQEDINGVVVRKVKWLYCELKS